MKIGDVAECDPQLLLTIDGCLYTIKILPAPNGLASHYFTLTKFGSKTEYVVACSDGRKWICTCRGWFRKKECKHEVALKEVGIL